ncbi:aminopeptidase P family protein [Paraburkholderia aspalathi]|nr:aminopeptidase P family protein [Paraburkholderia aspalathi]
MQRLLGEQGVKAVYLDASSSLTYFTGMRLGSSERLHGAIIPAVGDIIYITPAFEEPKTQTMIRVHGEVTTWEEHENPMALVVDIVRQLDAPGNTLALDPATPYVFADGIMRVADSHLKVISGQELIIACRQTKSDNEIAIIQTAMDASLAVHKAVYGGLYEGVTTIEISDFIAAAHRKMGLVHSFAAVQFGEATAYPHGVPYPQTLKTGDMVLVDMGAILHGYRSDITRTYVFGTSTPRQKELWDLEKKAQLAAFNAARLGTACEDIDFAARQTLVEAGYGPDYAVPGLPHRTGHGLGIDIHEDPYIVRGNKTALQSGMCFSIEPMLCVYGECGIRLEDIIYMTDQGPRWFTQPAGSIEKPF